MHNVHGDVGIHVIKRGDVSPRRGAILRTAAIVLALITGALFILALGHNPIIVYGTLAQGALGTASNAREMVKLAIPLCIASLGVALAFKMRFWNIGAEGQICIGAVAASAIALNLSDLPTFAVLILMILAGTLAGALWGLIPAAFKAKFGTNEVLFTLMLNYIAVYIIQFLREGPWKDPKSGFPKVPMFAKSARLPTIFGVHIGWIFALVLVVALFIYLRKTKQGYELTVVGENENTARYAGMHVRFIIIRTMVMSAGICGLAGVLQASGADRTLTDSVAGGVGFTAIAVAWLSKLNPPIILLTSILFACLDKGSGTIQSLHNISPSASQLLQGIILFFVLGCEFFIEYKIVGIRRGKK